MSENKASLEQTGGGKYQQHFLSQVEERIAVICNIFHTVEGVKNANVFTVARCSKESAKENQDTLNTSNAEIVDVVDFEVLTEDFTTTEQPCTSKATQSNTKTGLSPQRKKQKFNGDIQAIMSEEGRNFKSVSNEIKELKEEIIINRKYLRNISKDMEAIRDCKKQELKEMKRHHLALEKIAQSRLETKLEFLKLEQIRMGVAD